MELNAALAADLALLTSALDEPGVDVAESVRRLAADVRAAVPSYLGLRISAEAEEVTIVFTTLVQPQTVAASLMIRLVHHDGADRTSAVAVLLYAGRAGAFVDMAADLAWLASGRLGEFVVDEHLDVPAQAVGVSVQNDSVVNQAIGVLLGRGMTPEEAHQDLDVRAAAAGIDRRSAAERLLAEV